MRGLQSIRERVQHDLELAYQRQAANLNKHRTPGGFKVEDLVRCKQRTLSSAIRGVAAKLAKKYTGPFKISRVISPVVFELTDEGGCVVPKVSIDDFLPYREDLVSFVSVECPERTWRDTQSCSVKQLQRAMGPA